MKIRNGFVSNSNSSSFIVIEPGNHVQLKDSCVNSEFIGGAEGESEFGWDPQDFYDSYSKINFAFLQSENNPVWRSMLVDVIKGQTGCSEISWLITSDWKEPNGTKHGYIDHQSAACEGSNTELFDSSDMLRDFLFNSNSYIHTDNDNH